MVGFGEAYQMSDWDSADPVGAMVRLLAGIDAEVPAPLRPLRRYLSSRRPVGEENTVPGARENIHYHYDLSNEFFALFLDPSMTYSSAIFDVNNAGVPVADRAALHAAQLRKVNRLLDLAGIGKGTRVLEIGTGWGELAIRAARRGAIVHTLTISTEQHDLAVRRIAAEGLSDRVRVDICDYRDVDPGRSGGYDAVVSVEMIEAVGGSTGPTSLPPSIGSSPQTAGSVCRPSPCGTIGSGPPDSARTGSTSTSSPAGWCRQSPPSTTYCALTRGCASTAITPTVCTTRQPYSCGGRGCSRTRTKLGGSAPTTYSCAPG